VEQLLKVCHLLLWPHMLKSAAGEASCVSPQFLEGWLRFLVACQKQVKSMQPEDQAVKVRQRPPPPRPAPACCLLPLFERRTDARSCSCGRPCLPCIGLPEP
jgi:hypothetical protein